MIFAGGEVLPDSERNAVLGRLEKETSQTLSGPPLEEETVLNALDMLGRELDSGTLDPLIARYAPPGAREEIDRVRPQISRAALEERLALELGGLAGPRPFGRSEVRPLGVLFHVAPGNMAGLPAFTAVEGLLTGNVNLIKLPHGDKGLSLAAFQLLAEQEPRLAPYLYAFDLPSGRREDIKALAALADGLVVWGGDGAIEAARALAGPGCKLIEWGHRLSFAYVSGYEDKQGELAALADHIVETGQRLCSSCQVIFLDGEDQEEGLAFCRELLPYLEEAAAKRSGAGAGAPASLSGRSALLERIVDGRARGEVLLQGRGCSVVFRPDQELELSPMEGNVMVKLLPEGELMAVLRRQRGRLQTAGLICASEKREKLAELLGRAGVTRVTRAGTMSAAFPGEAHDGEYPLRRYIRVVDVEKD